MNIEHLTKEQWLELHQRPDTVTASQVFTLTGENQHESAYTLWARKMGTVPWQESNAVMEFGHIAEPYIAKQYEKQTGRKLKNLGDYTIVRHPDHPWLICTPDRLWGDFPIEFKTTRDFKAWMDDAPLSAQTQLQIQMACLDVNRGGIAALSRSDMDFLTFDFQRHDKLIEQLIEVAAEFRERCMIGDSPNVDGSDSTSLTLKAMYPRPTPDNTVQLPATAAMWASEWAGVKESVKILEDRERLLKNQIIEAIGDGEYGACGDLMFSYKAQTRKGYLKVPTEFADILYDTSIPFEETPETTFRVLREVKVKSQKRRIEE